MLVVFLACIVAVAALGVLFSILQSYPMGARSMSPHETAAPLRARMTRRATQ